jgi:hypothetical protein
VCRLKGRGWRASFIPASSGVRLPFRLLQGWQQATRFSHADSPARDRGITWSSVSSPETIVRWQYWHVYRSRIRMFLRESARVWCGIRRYSSRRITDGSRTAERAEWMALMVSSSAEATPFNTRTSARRAAQILIGS